MSGSEAIDSGLTVRRLKDRADFLKARKGARSHQKAFVLQVMQRNDGNSAARFGFTVTKKVGNAVIRNTIKRRLRETVREAGIRKLLPEALSGCDVVAIARIEALEEPFEDLISSLNTGLERTLEHLAKKAANAAVAKSPPSGQKHIGGEESGGIDNDSGRPAPPNPSSD